MWTIRRAEVNKGKHTFHQHDVRKTTAVLYLVVSGALMHTCIEGGVMKLKVDVAGDDFGRIPCTKTRLYFP